MLVQNVLPFVFMLIHPHSQAQYHQPQGSHCLQQQVMSYDFFNSLTVTTGKFKLLTSKIGRATFITQVSATVLAT